MINQSNLELQTLFYATHKSLVEPVEPILRCSALIYAKHKQY